MKRKRKDKERLYTLALKRLQKEINELETMVVELECDRGEMMILRKSNEALRKEQRLFETELAYYKRQDDI